MKNTFFLLISLFFSISSFAANEIVSTTITSLYKPEKKITLIQKDIDFWTKKLKASPNQSSFLTKLANAYSYSYSLTGTIEDLKKAENLLHDALAMPLLNRSSILRTLAHNYITQHRFCEALTAVEEAVSIGENKFANEQMLFDIYMELGEEEQARITLTNITNESNFSYLIRKSKWEDSKGNLTKAISYLEKAKKKAIASNNKNLMAWSYSNLGDYYGHNGEIEKSYQYFIKTLELDPANWYALKGIAWIAYANDRNTKLSKNILHTIIANNSNPDLYLELAELASYNKEENEEQIAINQFQQSIKNTAYGDMYNKYECLVAAENSKQFTVAYELAFQEISNRPTTESYDLLAWTLYLEGKTKAAQKIAKEHILGKSSEPEILHHLVYIFYTNPTISDPLLKEIEEAIFELGPLKAKEINDLIAF